MKNFKKIGDNLNTQEFNALVSLYKHFKRHNDNISIANNVTGTYADYNFNLEGTTILDNGIVITDETIQAEPKVQLTNPVFHYSTYILKLQVLHYTGVNIFDDNDKNNFKVVDTLEIELTENEFVNIPVDTLEKDYIITFDANVEIIHNKTEMHGIHGLKVDSTNNPIMKTEKTDLYSQLLDLNDEPYNLFDNSGKTIYFFEKLNLFYDFKATLNPIVEDEETTISVKIKDEDGSILVGEKVYFYEKYEPSIKLDVNPTIVIADENSEVTGFVRDAINGSRVVDVGKTLYFFEQVQHLVRSVTLSASKTTSTYGDSITLTSYVYDEDNNPIAHRSVEFNDGNNVIGKLTTNSEGKVVLTLSSLSAGTHNIKAYSDGIFSSQITITVNKKTPTLTISGSNINYGSNEVLTGNLSVGGGENVEIYQGNTLIDTVITNGNGGFSKTVTGLTVGSYTFKAVYNGNDNYNSANSSVINVTVSKQTPTLNIATNNTKITYGGNVSLTGTLSAGNNLSVKIYNGNNVIDTVTTGSGGAYSKTVTGLNAGTYTFKSSFDGNSYYNTVTSNNVGVTVNKATPTISLTGSNITFGDAVNLSGVLSNGANRPVKIYRNNDVIATVNTTTNGAYNKSLTGLNVGTYIFKSIYEGDSNYNSATSSNLTLTVSKAPSTVNLSVNHTAITYGESVTVSGTLSVGSGKSVKIYDGSTVIATVTTGNGGAYSKTFDNLNAGTHTFKAVFDTDANYVTSQSSSVNVTVGKQSTTISLTGQNVTYPDSVVLSGTLSVANKSVKIYQGSNVIATVTSSSTGSFSKMVTGLNAGTYTFKAVYEGDGNYITSNSGNKSVTVSKATPTMTFTSNNVTYPTAVSMNGTFSLTGKKIKLYKDDTLIDTVTVGSDGKFSKTTGYNAGSYTFKAVYVGDTNYNSVTKTINITISKGTPTITLTGQNVTYPTAITVNGVFSLTGKEIKIYRDNTEVGTVTSANDGKFSKSFNYDAGSYTFKAVYEGDDNYNGVNKQVTITVNKFTTTLSLTGQNVTYPKPINLNGVLSIPNKNILIFKDNSFMGTVTAGSDGKFSKTLNYDVGDYVFQAKYNGETNYTASNSNNLNISVSKGSPTVTLSTNSSSITYGQSITLSGRLTLDGQNPVKLYDGETLLDTITTNVNGSFGKSISNLSVGNHSFKVVYSGTNNYNRAESTSVAVTVNKIKPVISLSSSSSKVTYEAGEFTLSGSITNVTGSVTLNVYRDSTKVDSIQTNDNGSFSKVITANKNGAFKYYVEYAGDSTHEYVISNKVDVDVETSLTLYWKGAIGNNTLNLGYDRTPLKLEWSDGTEQTVNSITSITPHGESKSVKISNINSINRIDNLSTTGIYSITVPVTINVHSLYNAVVLTDLHLFWKTNPQQFNTILFRDVNYVKIWIPKGCTSVYTSAGYPSSRLVERDY